MIQMAVATNHFLRGEFGLFRLTIKNAANLIV